MPRLEVASTLQAPLGDGAVAEVGNMRPGDNYNARQVQIIRDAVAYALANLRSFNDTLGTNYKRREIEQLSLPANYVGGLEEDEI